MNDMDFKPRHRLCPFCGQLALIGGDNHVNAATGKCRPEPGGEFESPVESYSNGKLYQDRIRTILAAHTTNTLRITPTWTDGERQ